MLISAIAAPAAAGTPRCNGKKATIVGTSGPDRIRGTAGDDVIAARGGNDHVAGLGGDDLICGGRGADVLEGNRGSDRLLGGRGADHLNGGLGADLLRGGRGKDSFPIGSDPHADSIDGGPGTDLLNAALASRDGDPEGGSHPAHIDLSQGFARTEFGGRDALVSGTLENVYGSGHGDTIIGDDQANALFTGYHAGGEIRGGGGDDVLVSGQAVPAGTVFFGDAGDDVINFIEGVHSIDGGEGSDTLTICYPYAATNLPLVLDLEAGTASLDDAESTLVSIENGVGCGGDDVLRGDAGANLLAGGRGNDRIEARAGDDVLRGGTGTDEGDGGAGFDTCRGIETATNCES